MTRTKMSAVLLPLFTGSTAVSLASKNGFRDTALLGIADGGGTGLLLPVWRGGGGTGELARLRKGLLEDSIPEPELGEGWRSVYSGID